MKNDKTRNIHENEKNKIDTDKLDDVRGGIAMPPRNLMKPEETASADIPEAAANRIPGRIL